MKTRSFDYIRTNSSRRAWRVCVIANSWLSLLKKTNCLFSRAIFVVFSLFTVSACVSVTGPGESDRERSASSGINPHYKIGTPYEIVGDGWYYPAVDEDYSEIGIASWYGPNFHGKPTANGELFDKNALTAAHRTLPLPSIVEVQNLDNGKMILVRVNDRGPFAKDRIIDLSEAAAKKLGFINQGTARVRVRFIREATLELALLRLNDRRGINALEKELRYGAGPRVASQNITQDRLESGAPKTLTAPSQTLLRDDTGLNRISPQTRNKVDVANQGDDLASLITQSTQSASSAIILPGEGRESETAPISPDPERNRTGQRQVAAIIPQRASKQTQIYPDRQTPSFQTVYEIQLGAFSDSARAESEAQKAVSLGPVFILTVRLDDGRQVHKVMMGPFANREDAGEKLTAIRGAGYDDAWIVKSTY